MSLSFNFGLGTSENGDFMETVDHQKLWAEALAVLRDEIADNATYNMWLKAVAANSFEHNRFYLVTPHQMAVQLINSYKKQITKVLTQVCGREVDYELRYDETYQKEYEKIRKKESDEATRKRLLNENLVKTEVQEKLSQATQLRSEVNLNLKYKFENFVVGENSRMAFAVAQAVAENPGEKYNPLFIYGASGLGKTHLMQAIGHYIITSGKSKHRVKYIKMQEYINEVISNMYKGKGDTVERMEKFRQKFRNVDVLLIDDIQFIESKEGTMKEIFHTFEMLHNNGKQIVITSDRLPRDIPKLHDRLRTRFEMGILVELTPPEFETRIAILRKLAENDHIKMPWDAYELIAQNYKDNVRELEGAYNKVSAYAQIDGTDISPEYVKSVLGLSENQNELTMESIAQTIAEYYNVTVADFLSPARSQKISTPRQIVVYIVREMLGASFEAIAEFLQKKHTTMLYSYEKIKDEIKTNRDLKHGVEEIMGMLR